MKKKNEFVVVKTSLPRLAWSRSAIVAACSVSYRTVQNLEARGLLKRLNCGLKNALYSDESVRNLFGPQATSQTSEAAV